MSKDMQRLADFLGHMLLALERINRYTEQMDELGFLQNEMVQDAVIRNFEMLGEASNNIQKQFPSYAAHHPELPLAFAYQMRNVLVHGYFKIDYAIVWTTIQTELPGLNLLVRDAIADLG